MLVDDLASTLMLAGLETWKHPWWFEHAEKLRESDLNILTMTFCIKPSKPVDSSYISRLRSLPSVSAIEPDQTPTKGKRGRKRKIRKPFPNLSGSFKVTSEHGKVTFKVFKNSSMQACGCHSWDQMISLCRLVERLLLDGNSIKTVDVNNISLCHDFQKTLDIIPSGRRIALSHLGTAINASAADDYGRWETSSFHAQSRQTNLNLWWHDASGRRHYASVYPRGTLRITTTDIDMALHMNASIIDIVKDLSSVQRLTCLDAARPHTNEIETSPLTITVAPTAVLESGHTECGSESALDAKLDDLEWRSLDDAL